MQDRTIYSIGAIEGSARYISDNYNNTSISFISMNFDEIAKMNPIALEKQEDTNSFTGNRIIISKYTAEKYQLTIGDMMKFKIALYKRICIYAISYPAGIFKDESQKYLILPYYS